MLSASALYNSLVISKGIHPDLLFQSIPLLGIQNMMNQCDEFLLLKFQNDRLYKENKAQICLFQHTICLIRGHGHALPLPSSYQSSLVASYTTEQKQFLSRAYFRFIKALLCYAEGLSQPIPFLFCFVF